MNVARQLFLCSALFFAMTGEYLRGDDLTYCYDANTLPDPADGWIKDIRFCDTCQITSDNGILTIHWFAQRNEYLVHYVRDMTEFPEPPLPLWIEWRFASNFPLGPNFVDGDGAMGLKSNPIGMILDMYGDAIIARFGPEFVTGLPIGEFRTFRFETYDGLNYCIWYDGIPFRCGSGGLGIPGAHYIDLYGQGGDYPNSFTVNRWDYIRYGRVATGESVVGADPPSGTLDANQYPSLDRFTVTFDQPNYVHVDDVSVQTEPGASATGQPQIANDPALTLGALNRPHVIKTRRQDNGPPETVEIVLDQPMQPGGTYTFTFTTGGWPNTVTYTLVQTGACCQADGTCTNSTDADCASTQGMFTAGADCSAPSACCLGAGSCQNLAAICCSIAGGAPNSSSVCEGDHDGDGMDAACGDECPADPLKTSPGICGCGVSDVDTDLDGVPDCIDQCPGEDDRIDSNNNGVPDCVERRPIPTINHWGIVILGLVLLTLAKGYSLRHIKRVVS